MRRRYVELLLLATAVSSANYARTAVNPLQEAIKSAFVLSDHQIALLQGPVVALPIALAAVPLGMLVDRYRRVTLLAGLAGLNLFASLATAAAASFAAVMVARGLVGLTAAAIPIVALSLIADLFEPQQRGRAKILVSIGEIGGASAAFALGGWLLFELGARTEPWRAAMAWAAAPLVVVAIAMLMLREPARTGLERSSERRNAFHQLWRYRTLVVPLVIGKIAIVTGYIAVMTWSLPSLMRQFNLGAADASTRIAAALLIGGLVGPVVGGLLADYCQRTGGPGRTMASLAGLALLATAAATFATMPNVAAATVLLVLFMTALSAIGTMEMTVSTIIIPSELRGLCLAVIIASGLVFGAFAPLAVSSLSVFTGGPDRIGTALAVICMFACLLCALTFGMARRLFDRPLPIGVKSGHG